MNYIQSEEFVPEELVTNAQDLGVQAFNWFQDQVLSLEMGLQLTVVVASVLLAMVLVGPVKNLIRRLVDQISQFEIVQNWRDPLARFFTPVVLAALIFVLLSGAQVGLRAYEYPSVLARIGVSLAAAYVVIRLISGFIAEPFWSRTLARMAWLVAALNIFGWLAPVLEFLDTPLSGSGEMHISAWVILRGLFVTIVLLWLATRISLLLRTRIQQLPSLTPSVQLLLSKAIQVTLITAAILFALSSMNVDLRSLAIIGGALSFGIGFGMQQIFANLVSGVILLIDRSIKPGDVIEVDNTYGRVSSLGLRYTSVVTRDRKEHLIPNESFVTGKVVNWSYSDPIVRIKQKIGIAYHSDVPKAIELVVATTSAIPRVLKIPKVVCQLREFADSAVILEVRFWIRDSHNGVGNVSSEVMLGIWKAFHENSIDFPFPQRDVNLSSAKPIQVELAQKPRPRKKPTGK
ncbi:Potassium efflux system KefA protein / Small-conductance mechanosensitive channel [hydrothermal vent metagenome]|uniref:Potassium efflux system KefA protein / Small-conductance mechanosensitive channel n=1 Tax=hydrothermal vent metagenome TaxID=652676 RepID=A0A3B0RGG3_9ZZZZ